MADANDFNFQTRLEGETQKMRDGTSGRSSRRRREQRREQMFNIEGAEFYRQSAQEGQTKAAALAAESKAGQDTLAGQMEQDVQQRQGLVTDLAAQARGEGPSLAGAQLKQAGDRNLAQQLAMAGRSSGGSSASAQRQLMRNQQATGRDIASQAATARMQEQQSAQQQLGNLTTASQQQLGSQLAQQQQLASQLEQQYINQGFSIQQARQQAQAAAQGMSNSRHMGKQGIQMQQQAQNQQNNMGYLSAASSIGALAMSDKNMKKDVKKEDGKKDLAKKIANKVKDSADDMSKSAQSSKDYGKAMVEKAMAQSSDENKKKSVSKESLNSKDFLDKLSAYSYNYKDPQAPGAGEGRHFSVMAQDLEKAGSIGKSMVKDTNEGKMVDYGKGFGAILAAQVQLNDRLKQIEEKKKPKK